MGECIPPEGYGKLAIVGEWSIVAEEEENGGVVRCYLEDDAADVTNVG